MRLALALCLAAMPALAQDVPPAAKPDAESGLSLMEQGARLVLRGLMTEMEPALTEMEQALAEIGPALEDFGAEIGPKLRQLVALIDDFSNYAAPEMLPNGDILIRRTAPLIPLPSPPASDFAPGPNGAIDL